MAVLSASLSGGSGSGSGSGGDLSQTELGNYLEGDVSDSLAAWNQAGGDAALGQGWTENQLFPELKKKYQSYLDAGKISEEDIWKKIYDLRKAKYEPKNTLTDQMQNWFGS